MKSITAQRDQFKIALAYLAKVQASRDVSPYVKRAITRAQYSRLQEAGVTPLRIVS